jgi:diguanylate cyclase (GGDEF)-like protein
LPMPETHLTPLSPAPIEQWHALAEAMAAADDISVALDAVAGEVSQVLRTRASIVEHAADGWRIVAQARGGLSVSIPDLPSALNALAATAAVDALDLRARGGGVWTAVSLGRGGSSLTLLVAGDPTAIGPMLSPLALWLPVALEGVRERAGRREMERWVLGGYTTARRISRPASVERVCERIVERVARSLAAERVALALYQPEPDRLTIVAAHGYAAADVRDVRIEPGAWVMGHVYASGRPVFVPDARPFGNPPDGRRPYRSKAYAVVPIVAVRTVLGVLSATDKTDGSGFDRRDRLLLRTVCSVAALAMMAARNDEEVQRLSHAATVDSLTGLFNRPYFDARLHEEVQRAKRTSSSLIALMADIDDFKVINDSHGHQIGDAVLQAVAEILRSAVRVFDVCARYGGDEFAILLPGSDHASAVATAERIRQRVSEWYTRDEALKSLSRLTMSIGVAVIGPDDEPADLVRRADECLYRAKADGKNVVRTSTEPRKIARLPVPRHGTAETP